MIYPKKNKLIHFFFHRYIMRLVRGNFEMVVCNDLEIDPRRSILLIANHFSWWDGFLMYYVNHTVIKKRFYIMVLEETVRKVSFFKYMGAFSVRKNSKDVIASLDLAAELLSDPDNLVLIFPQGKLHSNFIDNIAFESGLSRLLKKVKAPFTVLMAATFTENHQHKKPVASVYLADACTQTFGSAQELQDIYNRHYQSAKQQQTKITV